MFDNGKIRSFILSLSVTVSWATRPLTGPPVFLRRQSLYHQPYRCMCHLGDPSPNSHTCTWLQSSAETPWVQRRVGPSEFKLEEMENNGKLHHNFSYCIPLAHTICTYLDQFGPIWASWTYLDQLDLFAIAKIVMDVLENT